MVESPVLILGANGQDGFLTTLLALERGTRVVAASRKPDNRLTEIRGGCGLLELEFGEKYLSDKELSRIIRKYRPRHVFHFASQHGPSGTMEESEQAKTSNYFLSEHVPKVLFDLMNKFEFGLTLPGSSRIYTGHLSNALEDVKISADTDFYPVDYYGEAKARMMILAMEARTSGLEANLPVLFNHDSIAKKKGYVGWAIAESLAKAHKNDSPPTFRKPFARIDLSSAVDFCSEMLDQSSKKSGICIYSAGDSTSVVDLATRVWELLPSKREHAFVSQKDFGDSFSPVLIGDDSHRDTFTFGRHSSASSIALMSMIVDSSFPFGREVPVHLLKALPESRRSLFAADLLKLIPVHQ